MESYIFGLQLLDVPLLSSSFISHYQCFEYLFLLIFTASETSSVSATSSATSAVRKHPDLPKDKPDNNQETEGEDASLAAEVGLEDEDTMKNLTKTFAGIFGKMN